MSKKNIEVKNKVDLDDFVRNTTIKKGKNPKEIINLNNNVGYSVKSAEHIKVRYISPTRIPWDKKKERYLVEYLRALVPIMKLTDWSFIIELNDITKNVFATMESQPDQKRGILTLTSKFLQLDSYDQKQTLVHEFIHCHLFNLHYQAEAGFKVNSTSKTQELFSIMIESEIERATDSLADVLTPFIPDFKLPS